MDDTSFDWIAYANAKKQTVYPGEYSKVNLLKAPFLSKRLPYAQGEINWKVLDAN